MVQQAIKQTHKHLSGFDLTTNLIRGGLSEMNISPNTKLVLLYLATCFNQKKGVVFPKLKTIAQNIGISEISCKRAIKELLKEGCILKSKRFKNSNEYILTNKILETKQNDTSKGIKMILPIEHELKQEEIKEQQPIKEEIKEPQKVVAFSSNFNKKSGPINMAEIPDIIMENPKIKNPLAYWRSLDDTIKAEYIRKEQEAAKLKARQEAKEKEREQQSIENYKHYLRMKQTKPFIETCKSKEQAIEHIVAMFGGNEVMKSIGLKSKTVKELEAKFGFNACEVLC